MMNRVLTAVMLQKLEGVHVGLLRKVTGMTDLRLGEETWRNEGLDRVIQAAGTKPLWS